MTDLTGVIITLALLAIYPQRPVVAILPVAIALMYIMSCVYHWLPYHVLRQKLDHVTIAVVVAVTYVPYWVTMLPWQDTLPRYSFVGILFAVTVAVKWFRISWHKTGGTMLLLLALFGSIVSFGEFYRGLPAFGFVCFWLGAILYLAQFAVYTRKRPDLLSAWLGYRGLQHALLLLATTLQTFVAVRYL
ncbi:MAG: hemolysin III family protein [bacterium]|nr:hemolysin III family protein [bacterium]